MGELVAEFVVAIRALEMREMHRTRTGFVHGQRGGFSGVHDTICLSLS